MMFRSKSSSCVSPTSRGANPAFPGALSLRLFTTILLIPLSPFLCRSGSAEAPRPNVLMIIVDDMNDWVGCLGGHPQVKTPHIDRLAKRGLLFTNAHVAAPVCNPSRAATLTGGFLSVRYQPGNRSLAMEFHSMKGEPLYRKVLTP